MSNHPRSSRLDTPSDTVDDVNEPPLPSRQTYIACGFPEQGGHGVSSSNRRLPRRPPAHRLRFIGEQEEGCPGSVGASEHLVLSSPAFRGESIPTAVASLQAHSTSYLHTSSHSSYPHAQPRLEQICHQQSRGDHRYQSEPDQDKATFYDPPQYKQPQQAQGQYQQTFPHPSPADSYQSASAASSSSDSSLLRHPHDSRLLQAQLQAATESSFEFSPQDHHTSPPDTNTLIPIRSLSQLASTYIPQDAQVGYPLSGPSGPAHSFYHCSNDYDFFHQRHPGVLQFPGSYPISFMQNSELSILNAESYDDGMSSFHAPRSLPKGRPQAVTGDEPKRSKKRAKAQASETGELEEEEKKRSRGRPRLDTNDETAKDRRRTQIRLAQRAYRNRKETAIQSLEKKVDELRRTNEEMSKEFMRLYDFAVEKGMHESTPEFGRQLQATTEKFVSLARRTSEEPENDEEPAATQDHECEAQAASPTSGREKQSDKSSSSDVVRPGQPLYGGFIVSHDEASLHSTPPPSHAPAAVHTTSWASESQPHGSHPTLSQAPLGYEIVTEPTLDNASFPFGMSFEQNLDRSASFSLAGQPFSESLFTILSAPSSYAYQERTFGRRLQRSTLEKAYMLARMPDPPPGLITSAFGFCLLFEPKERIVERLANRLSVNQRETMFNWKFPFLHLGGGGTWFEELNEMNETGYPSGNKSRRLVGNQGTEEPHRQKVDSVFGMGPWDAETEEMREYRLDQNTARLRSTVPGFEGDFYDSDEVEWVLQQRGVVIPPAADFVTAEIDPVDFSNDTSTAGRAFGTDANQDIAHVLGGLGDATPSSAETIARTWLGQSLRPTRPSEIAFNDTRSAEQRSEASTVPASIDPSLGGDPFGAGARSPNQASGTGSRKRLVTINIGVLVQEIGLKSVCLGRSPGVRPKDLNLAFWASLTT